MIHEVHDVVMSCDKCHQPLCHPKDSIFYGERVYEGERKHLIEVAKEYGWHINGKEQTCPKCYR